MSRWPSSSAASSPLTYASDLADGIPLQTLSQGLVYPVRDGTIRGRQVAEGDDVAGQRAAPGHTGN